jgi:hypothetical protein
MMLLRKLLWSIDKTLESILKTGINTKLPTCDVKRFFTDLSDDGVYRKRKYPTVDRKLAGERVWRRWLSYGLSP